jgi:hypothetical protein
MDMLNPDKTKSMNKYYCLIVLIVLLIGCNQNNKESDKNQLFTEKAQHAIGEKEYRYVYSQIIDSINNWHANELSAYRITNESWRIDSLLCFNQQTDRFVTALQYQITSTSTDHDGIIFFYGIKIKDKWYFFTGASIHLPREMYQQDIHTPLSFAKLHEIAMKEVFSGYLIEKKTKKDMGWWKNIFAPEYNYSYGINEAFFQGMENRNQSGRGFGSCFECQTFEEYVLYLVRKNWGRK